MNVVIICNRNPIIRRGLEVVALDHAKALQKRGMDVSIFCRGEKNESLIVDEIKVNTYRYYNFPLSAMNLIYTGLAATAGWKYHYGTKKIQIVHGHDYLTYFFVMLFLTKYTKKFFTVHDPLIYHQQMIGGIGPGKSIKRSIFSYIEKQVHLKSDQIYAISQYTMDRFETKRSNTKIRYDWTDLIKYQLPQCRNEVRNLLGLKNEFIIFTLRALEPRMGLGNLIQAFSLFQNKIPDSALYIGGKGPLMNELKALSHQVSPEGIKFLGFVSDDDLEKWYQAADVFVMPSLDGEGFGLPIIEAMASGTPALGTPVCAIPEVLQGKPERLFKGTDPKAIADGLLLFYAQWKNGVMEGAKERDYVVKRFSEEIIVPQIISDYEAQIE